MAKSRRILTVNLFQEGPVVETTIPFGPAEFTVTEHSIGWDFEAAARIIEKYDGYVDGIALSGVQKHAAIGKSQMMHPGYLALVRSAVKTPVYMADDVRDLFAEWTLQRLLKEQPQIFAGRRILFHCAVISPWLKTIAAAGGSVAGADALLLTGVPILLKGERKIEGYLNKLKGLVGFAKLARVKPDRHSENPKFATRLAKWAGESDVFVTFANLIERMPSLDCLKGKVIVADYLSPAVRERLKIAGAAQVIEFIPDHHVLEGSAIRHFSVLAGLLDQSRLIASSELPFNEYVLKWIQDSGVKPNRLRNSAGIVRRCAFIVHPLSQRQLFTAPGVRILAQAPKTVRRMIEQGMARTPVFHYGTLTGAVSKESGQEVVCDLYAFLATPKQLLSMDEEFLYNRMAQAAEAARKRGAAMIGLGAYTKVVGDGGVTVARRSPIPVTTGNSFSASTTLWAAREMVERMGMVPLEKRGNRIRGKAIIIGATGSIGRVSALLVSLVFDQIVLVATRPDKLLELREEIKQLSPEIDVRVTTNANPELHDTDLIVTATSNQSGSILDIDLVKPGAVICDCSRPLDITEEEAARRPDVLVIESGEVMLPGDIQLNCDIGLPKPSVYACLAETVLLTMEGRYEPFSLSKTLSLERVKEIYKIATRHGATLSEIRGPFGVISEEDIEKTRKLAQERLKNWIFRAKEA